LKGNLYGLSILTVLALFSFENYYQTKGSNGTMTYHTFYPLN